MPNVFSLFNVMLMAAVAAIGFMLGGRLYRSVL